MTVSEFLLHPLVLIVAGMCGLLLLAAAVARDFWHTRNREHADRVGDALCALGALLVIHFVTGLWLLVRG